MYVIPVPLTYVPTDSIALVLSQRWKMSLLLWILVGLVYIVMVRLSPEVTAYLFPHLPLHDLLLRK